MLDEWLIAVDTTTPFCVGARSGVGDYLRLIREFDVGCHCRRNVRPTRRFVMITSPHWLQHLHSDQRVRPIGILLREMKASLGQKRHELVVVIRDFGQRATAPERFKYVVVPLAEESRDIERWDFWPWRVSPRLPQCVTSDHLGSGLSAL